MPNTAVDMNSWAVSACYPQSTFCPLSDGLPYRTTGSLCPTFVPARLVSLAVKRACAITSSSAISDRAERTFELLRYLLEETAPVKLPTMHCPHPRFRGPLEPQRHQAGIFNVGSTETMSRFQSLPAILHNIVTVPCKADAKRFMGGLSVLPRGDCIITNT